MSVDRRSGRAPANARKSRRSHSPDVVIRALARLSLKQLAAVLRRLPLNHRRELVGRWKGFEHDGQRAPCGNWRVLLIRAGRGFGKTRAGAEWVSEYARTHPDAQIALVGANIEDARRVMVEGRSGVLAVARAHEKPQWKKGAGTVHFDSGAVATVFSAETPEALRGPEHHAAFGPSAEGDDA